MIEKIILHNFQSHDHTEIDLDYINIVSGDSNAGKTAVIRALCWVLGRIKGDYFVRKAGKKSSTYVTIVTTTHEVTKHRTGTEQYYIVKDRSTNKDQKFERMGIVCPNEISEILNIKDLNLQEQHDIIFLVQDTTTERASLLNKYLDYESLDQITDLCITTTNTLATSVRNLEAELIENNGSLEIHKKKIELLKPLIDETRSLFTEHNSLKSKKDILSSSADSLQIKIQEKTAKITNLNSIPDTKKAEELMVRIESEINKRNKLQESISTLISKITYVEKLKDAIDKFPKEISFDFDNYSKLINTKNLIISITENIKKNVVLTQQFKEKFDNIDLEIEHLKQTALENNLICSECQRPITEDVLHGF